MVGVGVGEAFNPNFGETALSVRWIARRMRLKCSLRNGKSMKPVRCGRADARGASATDRDSTKCAGSEPGRQGWRIFFAERVRWKRQGQEWSERVEWN